MFKTKKKTVGIRIPNHKIPKVLVNKIGNPILSTSVHDEDTIMASDHIVDVGPGAGDLGGAIVYTGEPNGIKKNKLWKFIKKNHYLSLSRFIWIEE